MYKYVHGGDIYSAKKICGEIKIIDFSANINPLGMPQTVKNSIINIVNECDKYPDPFCRELVYAISEHEKTNEEYIFCSNGAAEIIFRLAIAVKPKKALIFAPTFADYEKALNTVGCSINYYYLAEENNFNPQEDFIEKIDSNIDIVFICNPNNPTGQLCTKEFMEKVLKKCKLTNTILFVDECFMDFVDDYKDYSIKDLIKTNDNLIILKAFTKTYAMAGIRLGYAVTSNLQLIDKLRLSGQDWSVSSIAQAAGVAALKENEYITKSKLLVKTERQYLIEGLKSFGFNVYASKANYVFFKADKINNLDKLLISYGIMIRSCENYINLNNLYYRIAVRNREENKKLLQRIREVL